MPKIAAVKTRTYSRAIAETFFILLLGTSALLSAPGTARAGDWSSGGGEIRRTSQNPWFVKNTLEVRYCIISDPVAFAGMPTSPAELINKAFAYWKEELALSQSETNALLPEVEVGTQDFKFQPNCDASTDLRFYLGVLPEQSEKYIQDPTHFLGVAVRTDYDEVKLKGTGFIYISADRGPLSYNGEFLQPNAWHKGNGGLLHKVLVHELGHVLGFPHIQASMVMSEEFPEEIVRADGLLGIAFNLIESRVPALVPDMRHFPINFYTKYSASFRSFFELPPEVIYSRIEWDAAAKHGELWSLSKTGERQQSYGSLDVTSETITPVGMVSLWLPEKQQVFLAPDQHPYMTLRGPRILRRTVTGNFAGKSAAPSRMFLSEISPSAYFLRPTLGGVLDGKLYLDLLTEK